MPNWPIRSAVACSEISPDSCAALAAANASRI